MRTRNFDRVTRIKKFEIFNISLRELDVFLNIFDLISFKFLFYVQFFSISRLNQKISILIFDIKSRIYVKNYRRVLHRMNKKIHLTIIVNQENLEIYRQRKNVDSIILLFKLYIAFLDCFSRKKANILLKHEFYNHTIYLKKDVFAFAFVLYDMSRNEIWKFRRYLNKNLNKKFIRINCFDATTSILFVKKFEKIFVFA